MNSRWLVLVLAVLACGAQDAGASGTLRRLVLAAGANNGGVDRKLLHYAVSDAESFVRVLEEMGGLDPADAILLRDPDRPGFTQGLQELHRRVEAARRQDNRLEVLVYYSGHADERGLLLGGERLEYQTLRSELDRVEGDVRIAVLDACASGTITRLKGGQRYQPFLVDESFDMRGYAFLTSSSEDEAAQESDQIRASFFTHYLVSGLRGAADVTGDGRVTLNEAYQFAFGETLTRTTGTQGGVQHPTYDIKMSGTGDVVLTDVRQTTAGLRLGEELSGRIYIRNAEQQLIVELYKPMGRVVELGLAPGHYAIQLEVEPGLWLATLDLAEGERRLLGAADLRNADREVTAQRGGDDGRLKVELLDQPLDVVISDGHTLSLGFLSNTQDKPFRGAQLSCLVNQARERAGSQISGVGNLALKETSGWQLSGMVNWSLGALQGGQASGGVNIGPQVRGAQLAGSTNIAGVVRGWQVAGAVNVARELKGVQIGTVNYTGKAKGPQIGVVNVCAPADLTGVQVGTVNVAGGIKGWQVAVVNIAALGPTTGVQAGTVNVARGIKGWQVGVVNVAGPEPTTGVQLGNVNVAGKVKGWQIGVINLSQDIQGVPLGVFNYSHTGLFRLSAWRDELGYSYLTLASGSRAFYTSFTAGYKTPADQHNPALGMGVGIHRNRAPWAVDIDLNQFSLHADQDVFPGKWRDDNQLFRLRAQASRRIAPGLAALAGVSVNLLHTDGGPALVSPWGDYAAEWDHDLRFWPGFYAGLSYGR
jgi:hypothetical protein